MTRREYIQLIKGLVRSEGIDFANAANHQGFEIGMVPFEWFQAAARRLAQIILDR